MEHVSQGYVAVMNSLLVSRMGMLSHRCAPLDRFALTKGMVAMPYFLLDDPVNWTEMTSVPPRRCSQTELVVKASMMPCACGRFARTSRVEAHVFEAPVLC